MRRARTICRVSESMPELVASTKRSFDHAAVSLIQLSRLRANYNAENESKSIVTIICEDVDLAQLNEEQHDLALKYLCLCLSIEDRDQLSQIICKHQPDLITETVREAVAAYDPIIRGVHNAVDLSASCQDAENFLADFEGLLGRLKRSSDTKGSRVSEKSGSDSPAVNVGDFADVLRRHQQSLHRFLHQMAKNGGEVTEQYKTYVKAASAQFRSANPQVDNKVGPAHGSAGDMKVQLNKIFAALSSESQEAILEVSDNYAAYLMALDSVSEDRMKAVLLEGDSPAAGPGSFLARWQQFLDATPVTPTKAKGKVNFNSSARSASNNHLLVDSGMDQNGINPDHWQWPDVPDVRKAVEILGPAFRDALRELGKKHWDQTSIT
jgi:hypothetical protein